MSKMRGNLEVTKTLLKSGADINAVNSDNYTALHYACEKEFSKIVEFLLEKLACINIKNNKGLTAMDNCYNYNIRKIFE